MVASDFNFTTISKILLNLVYYKQPLLRFVRKSKFDNLRSPIDNTNEFSFKKTF